METSIPLILIVDDDLSVRRGLARLVRTVGWNSLEFSSAQELMNCKLLHEATCAVLDVQMPGITGIGLQDWLIAQDIMLPVIFLTGHGDVPCGVDAMKKGAVDFLLKPVDGEQLLVAIRRAIALSASRKSDDLQRNEIKGRHDSLTGREREVMRLVIRGRMNKQIADDLGISVKTVKVHRARALEKMGVRSVAALVHACYTGGISAAAAS